MFDFDGVVLAGVMEIFARPIVVDPLASQPGKPPYAARGVFTTRPVDVLGDGGVVYSDQQTTLGIRYSEFEVRPLSRDLVSVPAEGTYPAMGDFEIHDIDPDGEGHAKLILKRIVDR